MVRRNTGHNNLITESIEFGLIPWAKFQHTVRLRFWEVSLAILINNLTQLHNFPLGNFNLEVDTPHATLTLQLLFFFFPLKNVVISVLIHACMFHIFHLTGFLLPEEKNLTR